MENLMQRLQSILVKIVGKLSENPSAQRFIRFTASTPGRLVRVVLGTVMLMIGLRLEGNPGVLLSLLGIIPLMSGIFDVCLFAPLFGYRTMNGSKIRDPGNM